MSFRSFPGQKPPRLAKFCKIYLPFNFSHVFCVFAKREESILTSFFPLHVAKRASLKHSLKLRDTVVCSVNPFPLLLLLSPYSLLFPLYSLPSAFLYLPCSWPFENFARAKKGLRTL